MGPKLALKGLTKVYFSLHFFECRRREGNDLHWTWGGAHITETLKCEFTLKLLTKATFWYFKMFLRSYRFVWTNFGPKISWRYQSNKANSSGQKHWYDSLVPSPCCYFRLSTPPADLAWLGRTLSCGREQVCWDCRRQTGQDKEHTKILQLNSQTLVMSAQIWLYSALMEGLSAGFKWGFRLGGAYFHWGLGVPRAWVAAVLSLHSKVNALALVQKCNGRLSTVVVLWY